MLYLLYDLILLISAVFLLPFFAIKGVFGKQGSYGIRERLGYYKNQNLSALLKKNVIWIHAASVGETRVALLLIRRIKEIYPEHSILITNTTKTGSSVAQKSELVDMAVLFPVDLSFTVERLLKLIRPQLIVIVETEIWPNFTRIAHQLEIPLVMVNGRLSDRSFPRYRAIRFLLKPILHRFSAFCMQSQEDTKRIVMLGAVVERVENAGNLKFDLRLPEIDAEEIRQRKNFYRIPDQLAVLVAGSTHAGEEMLLIDSCRNISEKIGKGLLLVLIPRYPRRRAELQKLLKDAGIKNRLRSNLQSDAELFKAGEVLIVDTLGEVLDLYSLADLVFVGGSLVPVGGHNMLEASLVAKPVLFGPHVQNFKEISSRLIRAGAGIKVMNQRELEHRAVMILKDPARSRAMGEAGRSLIVENSGATERVMCHVARILR